MTLLHELPDFADLVAVVARNEGVDPGLVEKDYWIMHCLWGLQQGGFVFELKGGTSLSEGFNVSQPGRPLFIACDLWRGNYADRSSTMIAGRRPRCVVGMGNMGWSVLESSSRISLGVSVPGFDEKPSAA